MSDVFIVGCGMTPVGKYADVSIGKLGSRAILAALEHAGLSEDDVSAVYTGNMTSGQLCNQQLVSAAVAREANLVGREAITAEGACGSGAAAIRMGYMAIMSGCHDVVVVCGVEKMSHSSLEQTTHALATASDRETESGKGQTFLTLNACLMSQYIDTYKVSRDQFSGFSINAHRNAVTNPYALLRKPIDEQAYTDSRDISFPIRLYDAPPICDGAACVVLANSNIAQSLRSEGKILARIRASTVASDTIALSDRPNITRLSAVEKSVAEAYKQARMTARDIDFFEPHDAFTVMTAISLEAAGFAEKGRAIFYSSDEDIGLQGRIPICTFGGLKARGHPVGATGVYQMAEAYLQLTEEANENQVLHPSVGMVQNISGLATVVFTNIIERR